MFRPGLLAGDRFVKIFEPLLGDKQTFDDLDEAVVRVLAEGTGHGRVDDALAAHGVRRRIRLTVPHYVALGDVLRQGDLVAKRLAAKKEPTDIIDEVFVRCLTRRPTDAEKQKLMAMVASETDKKKALEDVFWAVLNSREFMFNH